MSKLIKTLTVAATAFAFATPAAFAGDMDDATSKTVKTEYASTGTVESRTITLRNEMEAEVRGALATGEFIAVEGPDGRIYYNKVVPVSELPDPTLDIEEYDTYTFEHRGMTFTNKIVQEVG